MNTNTRITKVRGTNKHEYTNNSSIREYSLKKPFIICKFVSIRDKGMSLVELLVSIAIIVLLLVIGVPAYRHYSYVNDLNQAAQDVKNTILETKNLALAPSIDKPSDYSVQTGSNCQQVCSGGGWGGRHCWTQCSPIITDFNADSILFVQTQNYSNNTATIYYGSSDKLGQILSTAGNTSMIKQFILPNSIKVISGATIQFSIAQSGKIIYPTDQNIEIILTSDKLSTNNTKTIKVNRETGQVSIE